MEHDEMSFVTVTISWHGGMYFAKSKQLQGLFVCAETNDQLSQRLVQAISKLVYFSEGVKVRVDPVPEAGVFGSDRPVDKFAIHRVAA
ncbi:hypothetical protein KEC55_11535 [Burkholderia cepacia]|uniref:hypothetical protein n=1 Tax=Burkholderia cepacia TaxID=292 RepID=UPI00249F4D5E|nr:hypothetical protein [Burkholderia cepacia]WGY67479.1 hypothetical protein KEC55_11535 [Burkholderia cepacia]